MISNYICKIISYNYLAMPLCHYINSHLAKLQLKLGSKWVIQAHCFYLDTMTYLCLKHNVDWAYLWPRQKPLVPLGSWEILGTSPAKYIQASKLNNMRAVCHDSHIPPEKHISQRAYELIIEILAKIFIVFMVLMIPPWDKLAQWFTRFGILCVKYVSGDNEPAVLSCFKQSCYIFLQNSLYLQYSQFLVPEQMKLFTMVDHVLWDDKESQRVYPTL